MVRPMSETLPRHPDFDDGIFLWDDSYSGRYQPVSYAHQFDDQWRLFLEKRKGFHNHTGVETADEYIDDRIYEITGVRDYMLRRRFGPLAPLVGKLTGRTERAERRGVGGRLYIEPKFPIDFFKGKRCLDLGCGAGRWTKTLIRLGAKVKSADVSPHALKSVRRFNPDVEELSVFDILPERPDLHHAFDTVLCWGVLIHVHDPKLGFANAAAAVKPGGHMYFAVYAPTYHASDTVRSARKRYHRDLKTFDERLAYAYELTNRDPDNAINYLDMLNTFYDWTVDEQTIRKWCADNGFNEPIFLNRHDPNLCHHHVPVQKPARS